MNQYSFLPMSIENENLKISEPFGSRISKDLPQTIVSKDFENVSINLKGIKKKKEFIDGVERSIKKIQQEMIDGFLNKKSVYFL